MKTNKLQYTFVLLILVLPVFSATSFGQTRISSPYTMYGIGEVYFNNNFRNLGMGGLAIGFQSNTAVNYINPASYSGFENSSFVFDAIVFSHLYEQKTIEQNQMANYSSIGHLLFGFPVMSWWKTSFGLTPYSSLGYRIYDRKVYDDLGSINYMYEGDGGINQVFWGNAFNLGKGFSVGINSAYLFGNFNNHSLVSSDSTNFYLSHQQKSLAVDGFMFNLGTQYKHVISSEKEFVIGAIFGNQTNLSATETYMQRIYIPGITLPDTVNNYVNADGALNLPKYWGVGATKKFNNNWMAGFDFYNQNWESFKLFEQAQSLNNSYQIALGAEYTPNQSTFSSFLTRARYTAGLRYKQTYIIHNNYPVTEIGLGMGFNFRLRRSLSGMTFAFEWANRGDINNHLLREDIFRFNLGINIHERWFIRSKFF